MKGASESRLSTLEAALGVILPASYRAYLSDRDGQGALGEWLEGTRLLSADEVERHAFDLRSLSLDFGDVQGGVARGFSDRWIPIATPVGGSVYVAIDLAPSLAEGGSDGQIIRSAVDDDSVRIIAPSFDAVSPLRAREKSVKEKPARAPKASATTIAPDWVAPTAPWRENPDSIRCAAVYVAADAEEGVSQSAVSEAVSRFWQTKGATIATDVDAQAVTGADFKAKSHLATVVLPASRDDTGRSWFGVFDSAPYSSGEWVDDLGVFLHHELGVTVAWFSIGPKTRLVSHGSAGARGLDEKMPQRWQGVFVRFARMPAPFFRFSDRECYDRAMFDASVWQALRFEPAHQPYC